MKATGNQPGLIAYWKDMVERGRQRSGPDADAVRAWLPAWQVRPYYTAAELAPIFPMIAVGLGLRKRPEPQKGAARLENELRMAGLPHFEHDGKIYFVVEQCHRAKEIENDLLNSMETVNRAGCTSRRGIRLWEDLGFLGEVARSAGDTRQFTDDQLERARIIAAAQFGGWKLEEIKEMLGEYHASMEGLRRDHNAPGRSDAGSGPARRGFADSDRGAAGQAGV
jgi:hypothetical protein